MLDPGVFHRAHQVAEHGAGHVLDDLHTGAIQLAHRTGPSPADVSHYLTALRGAGLVSAHRAGRSVLHARTAAADTLLKAASAT
ncbi:helix-turn-helix domain-containing protein [Streptomyces sp. NPDC001966]